MREKDGNHESFSSSPNTRSLGFRVQGSGFRVYFGFFVMQGRGCLDTRSLSVMCAVPHWNPMAWIPRPSSQNPYCWLVENEGTRCPIAPYIDLLRIIEGTSFLHSLRTKSPFTPYEPRVRNLVRQRMCQLLRLFNQRAHSLQLQGEV